MSAPWNPTEAARLTAELLEDDARMNQGRWVDWSNGDGRDRVHQIGCAPGDGTVEHIAVIESFYRRPENVAGIARLRNNARAIADQLEAAAAEVARLQSKLMDMCESVADMNPDETVGSVKVHCADGSVRWLNEMAAAYRAGKP